MDNSRSPAAGLTGGTNPDLQTPDSRWSCPDRRTLFRRLIVMGLIISAVVGSGFLIHEFEQGRDHRLIRNPQAPLAAWKAAVYRISRSDPDRFREHAQAIAGNIQFSGERRARCLGWLLKHDIQVPGHLSELGKASWFNPFWLIPDRCSIGIASLSDHKTDTRRGPLFTYLQFPFNGNPCQGYLMISSTTYQEYETAVLELRNAQPLSRDLQIERVYFVCE